MCVRARIQTSYLKPQATNPATQQTTKQATKQTTSRAMKQATVHASKQASMQATMQPPAPHQCSCCSRQQTALGDSRAGSRACRDCLRYQAVPHPSSPPLVPPPGPGRLQQDGGRGRAVWQLAAWWVLVVRVLATQVYVRCASMCVAGTACSSCAPAKCVMPPCTDAALQHCSPPNQHPPNLANAAPTETPALTTRTNPQHPPVAACTSTLCPGCSPAAALRQACAVRKTVGRVEAAAGAVLGGRGTTAGRGGGRRVEDVSGSAGG